MNARLQSEVERLRFLSLIVTPEFNVNLTAAMRIIVEFFGVPRSRVGAAELTLEFQYDEIQVANVIGNLQTSYPELATTCFQDGWLKHGYTLNLNGDRFLDSSSSPLKDGDHLLLMSTDAGG